MSARLLLADDSITIQRVIELTFADEDVTVVAVGDGDAAIARLEAEMPDIVLADVGMPGRDGYAVAAHVKATPALAHIPVLLLAGAFEPVDEARVAETGCAGVLVKPFEPQMVIARVRSLLESRRKAPQAAGTPTPPEPVRAPSPAEEPTAELDAASALLAAPAAAPVGRSTSVDDYFDRLDAAFAHLQHHQDATPQAAPRSERPAPGAVPDEGFATPVPPSDTDPAASVATVPPAPGPLSMADAFDALLDVEQGAPPPVLPDAWSPIVTSDLVEQVARRVADQVSDRVVREIAPEIVTRVAERLVREELARLRAEAEAS